MRVIEFGSYLAGPLVGRYLTDLGFEVVCVTRPPTSRGCQQESDFMHHMTHDIQRGKTVVEIDLATQAGLRRAHKLIERCDVVLENFGEGVAERMGIGQGECSRLNPQATYVSIPGYSRTDGKGSTPLKAWDSLIMASTGVFSDMGLNRTLQGVTASFSPLPMPSVYGSIFAALATVVARFNGSSGGIEVPLASSLAEALVHNSIQIPLDDRYRSRRALRLRDGPTPVTPEELDALLDPFFRKYVCEDGRPVYLVCPAHARHQEKALECLGISADQVALPRVDPYAPHSDPFGIGSGRLSEAQSASLLPHMEAAFKTKPSKEWERAMGEGGVPLVAHRSCDEWIRCPHAHEAGLVGRDSVGRCTVGPLAWMNPSVERPARASYRCQTMRTVRVLDLCNVIAGPTIGRMLARFGADVIKVDPVLPAYSPDITVVYGVVANMGKRSTLLDITTSKGREVLEKLICESDVVLANATSDCLTRLGLTDQKLKQIHPDAILMRFDAWGGCHEGEGAMSQFVGYDDNVQAGIGIMHRFGGGMDTVEEHAHVGTIDVIAGVAGALGVVAALWRRKHQGKVHQARTSLASVGQYLQYPFMFGRPFPSLGKGVLCRGVHQGHKLVRCQDGWILLVASLLPSEEKDAPFVPDVFEHETSEEVCAELERDEGIAACRLRRLCDVVRENRVSHPSMCGGSYQYITLEGHPIGCVLMVAPVAIRSKDVLLHPHLFVAPKPGLHTKEVVEGVIKGRWWMMAGDASTGWSRAYIPASNTCDACQTRRGVVSLSCEHSVCCACLERHRHSSTCPSCGRYHILDRDTLRSVTTQWRKSYSRWRKGSHRGSKDMERLYLPPLLSSTLRRVSSSPILSNTREVVQVITS